MEYVVPNTSAMIEEDEIDLRELARTIAKNKKFIITFSTIVTVVTLLWTFSLPNQYSSSSVMIPQDGSSSGGGGLSTLAGLAGVNIGGGSMGPDEGYKILLDNHPFMTSLIVQYGFDKRLTADDFDKNYVFAFNSRGLYGAKRSFREFFFPRKPLADDVSVEIRNKVRFLLEQRLSAELSINTDKQTGTITIACNDSDPVLAKDLVNAFIKEASNALKDTDMADLQNKLNHYQEEMDKLNDITIKTQVSQLMSALIQTKVQANASEFYNVKMITRPSVAYVRDKEGPNRGLIVVVSLVTSLILGIFWVFFREFLRKDKEEV